MTTPATEPAVPKIEMADISDPGTEVLPTEAVAFYIGGATPHVWTREQVVRQTARWRVPIWVPSGTGTLAGKYEGDAALAALDKLGAPHGCLVVIDMEARADPDFCHAFRDVIAAHAHWCSVYGSKSTIEGNPRFGGGYWVADWTGTPHMADIDGAWATQWGDPNLTKKPWDLSVVADTAHLWDTQASTWQSQAMRQARKLEALATALQADAADLVHLLGQHQ